MNIIVTKNKQEYKGFLKLGTLREAQETRGKVDFLVIHKSPESTDEKVLYLNQLRDRVGTIVYICNENDTDSVVKMMVLASDGKYFDDEYFLDDGDDLYTLVSSLDEVTEIAELGGVSVLSDFLNRYLKNGSSSFNSGYLMVVKDAVQNLIEEYDQKNNEILVMSESATELFSNTAEVLSGMRKEQGEMKKLISKLENEVKKSTTLNENLIGEYSRGSSVIFFPQVSYKKERNIVRIKEIGHVRYLTSFMMGFRLYMETIKNVRPKLIILESVGDLIEKEYEKYHWVTQRTVRDRKEYYNSIVFTNCPNKDVLQLLLDDQDYDFIIVVDRTRNTKSHILNSRGSLYYAVGSQGLVDKFSLPAKNCFSVGEGVKSSLFTIQGDSGYPADKASRERYYLSNFGTMFDMLV